MPKGAKKIPLLPLRSSAMENAGGAEIGWSPPSWAVTPVV
jgi:hypothetical protein